MQKSIVTLLSIITLYAMSAGFGTAIAAASTVQSHAEIRNTVTAFVRAQTQAMPGKITIHVSDIDRRISLPACSALEAFLPPGTQLNGNSTVGIRCNSQQGWSLFVPVNVIISLNMLTAKKTLQQGQTLRAEDLGSLSSETLQSGTLTDPAQAIGKIMKYGVAAGQILRQDMLRAPYTVIRGQSVQMKVVGSGFRVSAEGQALNNAAEGETTSARTASGQIVSGIVRGGAIEINP